MSKYTGHISIKELNQEFHSANLKRLMDRSESALKSMGFSCDMTTLRMTPPVDAEDLLGFQANTRYN